MPTKSTARSIKDALVTLLEGITYNAEPAFGLVTDDPSLEANQEPFALVYPAPSTSKVVVVGEQDRTTCFDIFVTLSLENGQRTQVQTYNLMYDLTELIQNCLDVGDFNDSLNAIDTSLSINLMTAESSTFYPAKTDTASVLMCQVKVCITWLYEL